MCKLLFLFPGPSWAEWPQALNTFYNHPLGLFYSRVGRMMYKKKQLNIGTVLLEGGSNETKQLPLGHCTLGLVDF